MSKERTKQRSTIAAVQPAPATKADGNIVRLPALLARYGYQRGVSVPETYDEPTPLAVMRLQNLYRIHPETTINVFNEPRCDLPNSTPDQCSASRRLVPVVTVGGECSRNPLSFTFLSSAPSFSATRKRDIKADGQYDQLSWGATAYELITVEDPRPGTYHVPAHSYRGSGSGWNSPETRGENGTSSH